MPADLVDKYPQFYWNRVSPHIQDAIRYLNVTSSGRQWINGCVLLHTYLWREFKARLAVRDIARDMVTRSWIVGRIPDETARQIHSSYGGGRDVSVHREAFAFAASWD